MARYNDESLPLDTPKTAIDVTFGVWGTRTHTPNFWRMGYHASTLQAYARKKILNMHCQCRQKPRFSIVYPSRCTVQKVEKGTGWVGILELVCRTGSSCYNGGTLCICKVQVSQKYQTATQAANTVHFSSSKCIKTRFQPELCHKPCLGELMVLPYTP